MCMYKPFFNEIFPVFSWCAEKKGRTRNRIDSRASPSFTKWQDLLILRI